MVKYGDFGYLANSWDVDMTCDDKKYDLDLCAFSPGLVCVKDLNSHFLGISQSLATGVGWKKTEEAIGKANSDLPFPMAEFAHVFDELDRRVIQRKEKMLALDVQEYAKRRAYSARGLSSVGKAFGG